MIGAVLTATLAFGGASTASAAPLDIAVVDDPSCGQGCSELDRVAFDHPTWGPSQLVLGVVGDGDAGECQFSVIDGQGAPQWSASGAGCGFGGSIYRPAPDTDGNFFIDYSTGRYPGITVLRPVADGMEDFRSLPFSGSLDGNSARFGDSQLFDVEGDGRFEILSLIRPCDPSCADGQVHWQVFAWNGADFVADICTQSSWPTIPVQATPEPGGTVTGNIAPGTCGVQTTESTWLMEEWIPVSFDRVLGWAPSGAFVPPPTEPPENQAPWAQPESASAQPSAASGALVDSLPLSVGASGPAVVELQLLLLSAGISTGTDGARGQFGIDTARAVAMLHDEAFSSMMAADPGELGVLTSASFELLKSIVQSNTPLVENGPCAGPSDLVLAAQADGPWLLRVTEIRCSGGWAIAGIREYAWTDGSTLFFTVGAEDVVYVGGVYLENGCEIYGVPAAAWEFLGCGAPPASAPTPMSSSPCTSYRFNDQYPIRRCDEGYAVSIIQNALASYGYLVDVDGYFGPGTEVAVRAFQSENGLEVDGLVGQATWSALTGGSLPGYDLNGNGIIDPVEVIFD